MLARIDGMRTTIDLDDELAARLRALLPARRLNRFINETLTEKVDALERRAIEDAMKEGYLAEQRQQYRLVSDWEPIETEDWPEK